MSDIDRILDQLGVRAQPTTPASKPQLPRPAGTPDQWVGTWHRSGDIPH